ncbi:hypothetical protein GCM10009789_62520 [Kribbella sancticallisti]|uniref:Dynamin family protein n=1 Tax=Kribbella sancticallisti TaxID=460087 RepID=A0ABN2EAF3_9ACTN
MADTRSAAGEGSERSGEPKVPAQDQAAHELAKLITEPDAKGKGFWRRRKRKASSTPEPAPAAVAAAPVAEVPAGKPAEAGPEPEVADAAPVEVEATDVEAATADAEVADKEAEAEPAASEEAVSDEDASETPAEASVGPAEETPAADLADEKLAEDAAEVSTVAESEAESADDQPKVGVTYEPEESPDGFPLEYGEIIIGLPKQSGAKKKATAEAPDEADAAEDDVAEDDLAEEDDVAEDDLAEEDDVAEDDLAEEDDVAEAMAVGDDAAEDEQADAAVGSTSEGAAETKAEDEAESQTADSELTADDADQVAGAPDEEIDVAGEEVSAEVQGQDEATVEPAAAEADAESAADAEVAPEDAPEAVAADDAEVEEAAAEAATVEGASAKEAASEEVASGEDVSDEAASADPASEDAALAEDAASDREVVAANGDEAGVVAEVSADGEGSAEPVADEDSNPSDSSVSEQAAAEAEAEAEADEAADEDSNPSDSSVSEQAAAEAEAEAEADEAAAEAEDDPDAEAAAANSDSAGDPAAETETETETEAEAEAGAGAEVAGDAAADGEAGGGAVGESGSEGEAESAVVVREKSAEEQATEQAAMALITALMKLRGALAASMLPLDVVGADEARQQQKVMLDQLDDYILPRLVQLEAPVLAVVGGSTGAGKSTLVNSLIGQVVSEPGVLRPTTRSPVLIHNPADAEWFTGDRVLPGMARSSGDSPGGTEDPGQIRLVAADTIPPGLAVLDAPDIDSVVEANRDLATQLLAAADLWLFVTTAARYADAVPWEFLQSASDRSTAVAVVLDRAPADTIDDITGHLAQMLLERGLGDSPLFSIKETVVDSNGMLPSEVVASIKDWLIDLAADAEARSAVVRRTLQGAVTAMTKKTPAFAKAVRAQADTVVELRSTAETAYDRAVKDVAKATQDGTMLRGEVLARWQEFVGTGELLKGLQTNVGRIRDKVRTAVVGKPPPTRDLNDAVESGLESLLREHAEAAAERAEESWQSTAAGRQLLASGDRDMGRMSKEFPAEASRAVREWQGYVLELVRKEGADKRSTARILSYGVNGLGLSLMVVVFASTAGIPTGAELGVGAGTAVVGQKLLEAIFGDQAVRSLAAKARENLDGRVHALMDAEFARYLAVLDQHPVDPDAPRLLTEAARAVEDCT